MLNVITEPRVISMNMPQNTAPESYYSDQTEVKPKSRDGKQKKNHQPPKIKAKTISLSHQSLSLQK